MKPPISYYGGKQRMAPKIVPLIPKHTVYVEPFCGGAAVMFAKPRPNVSNTQHYREVINDHDERLVNFYRVLRDPVKGPELVRQLELTPFSEAEHREAKGLDSGDEIRRAWAYYVTLQTSFSNVLHGGWSRAAFGRDFAATWANKVSRLGECLERMSSVNVACDDALKIIKQWDSPQTFFYCDPPYPGADQGHYGGYALADFQSLVAALDECEGSFILSNYDQPGAKIPRDWERFEFEAYASSAASRNGSGKGKRTEVVWRRMAKGQVRPEIQKLYDSGAFDCFTGDKNG